MKLATLLILSLVILGAVAQIVGGERGKGKLLRTCGIDRDFCDRGERAEIAPLDTDCKRDYVGTEFESGEKPEREDCTVGETVSFPLTFISEPSSIYWYFR